MIVELPQISWHERAPLYSIDTKYINLSSSSSKTLLLLSTAGAKPGEGSVFSPTQSSIHIWSLEASKRGENCSNDDENPQNRHQTKITHLEELSKGKGSFNAIRFSKSST